MRRQATLALSLAALAACFLFAAGTEDREACAGDDTSGVESPKKSPKKSPKQSTKKKAHLAFQKTYEAALLEARIRNVPVFVSRHKDF